jgi:F-type H+-transporting ATPase subunit gamma
MLRSSFSRVVGASPLRMSSVMPVASATSTQQQQRRSFATEQQLKRRIMSVTNIAKITKAMKMVASAKLRNAQSALDVARVFIEGTEKGWAPTANKVVGDNALMVGFSSDKGLCGGVHSVIMKVIREQCMASKEQKKDVSIIALGERAKAGLERLFGDRFVETVSESGKIKLVSFMQCCELAQIVLDRQAEFDDTVVVYNHFKSAIAYVPTQKTVPTLNDDAASDSFWDIYEFEGNKQDVLEQYHQFRTACRFYYWSMEAATSEQSSRVTAMDNSSTNAVEMLDALSIVYNRNRQARITTELIEIISGASAAEEMV